LSHGEEAKAPGPNLRECAIDLLGQLALKSTAVDAAALQAALATGVPDVG